jgi:SAM-dependent methyltransferase
MRWLKLKETRDVHDLDSPSTTVLHGKIIRRKAFLRKVYLDFYEMFRDAVPGGAEGKRLVEIGSGGGFIKEVIPNVTTSDVLDLPEVDMVFSALQMPFEDESVDAFFMIDVLHHLKDSRNFLKEAQRCLKTGGVMAMVEPANTLWGRFVYTHLHHEPFDVSEGWGLRRGDCSLRPTGPFRG